MRRHWDGVSVSELGDAARYGEPPNLLKIRRHDAESVLLEDASEALKQIQVFTGRNRNRHLGAYFLQCVAIIWRDRILQPE